MMAIMLLRLHDGRHPDAAARRAGRLTIGTQIGLASTRSALRNRESPLSDIEIDKSNGILTLTFDRPRKKNAITDSMYAVLADELEGAEADADIRVILIRSEGDVFTAGNDLADFAAANSDPASASGNVGRFIRALASATRPLVAAVQGPAVGIGTTMLLHCDYVLLSEAAVLTTPFVNLALVPEAASSLLLPLRIGHARAFGMFALGEPVTAGVAVEWGLANRVVPAEALHEAALAVARRLAAQPFGSVTATKTLMRDVATMTARLEIESIQFQERLKSSEAREAFTAFAERRKPVFH
jgi:enoyl-CoA hydratase/carnithine racemase